jgi:hypothetical protein
MILLVKSKNDFFDQKRRKMIFFDKKKEDDIHLIHLEISCTWYLLVILC